MPRRLQAAWRVALMAVLTMLAVIDDTPLRADEPQRRVLIFVGPSNHPPGTHEVSAGARLIQHCLEHAENVPPLRAEIRTEWPTVPSDLAEVATVVFTGDRFPPAEHADGGQIMADLSRMMGRGCGIVCVHYATGLGATHVAADGEHPLLHWMGGYFATRCPHHQSIAKVFTATIEPVTELEHPVVRGWKAFTLTDEPYIRNYFGPDGLAANVTPLAVSMLPPEAPQREVVAWGVTRPDGGRGVGVVMPHFFRNWREDDLRMLIMNAIVWTAQRDVPAEGVRTTLPELSTFAPASVEPQPRR
jgi:hypothetical protein